MAGAGTFTRKPRVRQANRRDAVFLFQIPAHKGLRRILLPVRKPREDQQAWTLDFVILSGHGKGLLAHADAAHQPLAAGAQIGLHLRGLELPFGTPPFHAFIGISQRLKDPFRRPFYRDFLNNRAAYTCRMEVLQLWRGDLISWTKCSSHPQLPLCSNGANLNRK
jgi:hypothetical protein